MKYVFVGRDNRKIPYLWFVIRVLGNHFYGHRWPSDTGNRLRSVYMNNICKYLHNSQRSDGEVEKLSVMDGDSQKKKNILFFPSFFFLHYFLDFFFHSFLFSLFFHLLFNSFLFLSFFFTLLFSFILSFLFHFFSFFLSFFSFLSFLSLSFLACDRFAFCL